MKFFGNSVQTRWIRSLQICVHSWRHREVADVVAHAGGARGEDREVGAALALELELRALDRGADLVVGHLQARARRQRRLVLDRFGLVLAEAVQVLGLGRVVAVTIDDHDAFTAGGGRNARGTPSAIAGLPRHPMSMLRTGLSHHCQTLMHSASMCARMGIRADARRCRTVAAASRRGIAWPIYRVSTT